MRLVDANVLLYAVNADSTHHEAARTWLDRGLSGADSVGFVWLVQLAFLRLVTRPALFKHPLAVVDALDQLEDWTAAPGARTVHPGPAHHRVLRELLTEAGTGGNLVNDAHLAAIAAENRADVVTYDTDFSRFRRIRSYRPDELIG